MVAEICSQKQEEKLTQLALIERQFLFAYDHCDA